MADNPASLAQAAARIEALTVELDAAKVELARAEIEIAQHAQEAAAAQQQSAQAQQEVARVRQQLAASDGEHAMALRAVEAATAKAVADRDALVVKWDALYGPVEDGIALGPPPYVTVHDGQSHATLEAARVHLVAHYAGVTHGNARTLIERAGDVVPLLQRIAPKP